jgi:ketosteroid isomerase-like protein
MTETERAQLVRRGLDAWNRQDVGALLALCDAEVEFVNSPQAVEPGTRRGLEAVKTVFETQWDILAGAELHAQQVFERDDGIVTVGTISRRMPGSEAVIEAPFYMLWRVTGGRVSRIQVLEPDAAEVQDALGRAPRRARR